MKLALHRSITFWSGILVLAFMSWAWRDSVESLSRLRMGRWTAISAAGSLTLDRTDDSRWFVEREKSPSGLLETPFPTAFVIRGQGLPRPETREAMLAMIEDLQSAVNYEEKLRLFTKYEKRGTLRIFIPYWILCLSAAALWFSLLLWRARRRKKATVRAA